MALHARCLKAKITPSYFSLTVYHIVSLELALFFGGLIPRSDLAARTDFGENKVREALAWYQANMMLGPNIETVADAVHVSSTHLRRLFHQVRNMSPQVAFTQLQFERAKELMLDKAALLERIAESSGFGSASSFSRAFKNAFGSSPQVYRSKLLAGHLAR
jgi:AraC family transcriptional regulator